MRKLLLITPVLVAIFFLNSCKDDRVEPTGYESMDAFYDSHEEEEQEFEITSDTGDCLVGRKGTIVCPIRFDMQKPNGDSVFLPYTVKLIELYGNGDMILNRKPTTSGGEVLNSAGAIKLTAFKDGDELSMRNNEYIQATLSTENPNPGMAVYQGDFPNNEFTDWEIAPDGSTASIVDNKYELLLGTLGWNSSAEVRAANTVTVTFTINATGTENIQVYAVAKDYVGVVRGSNLVIEGVPAEQDVTLVAFALDAQGNFRLYSSEVSLSGDTEVALTLDESISEDNLLNFIRSL